MNRREARKQAFMLIFQYNFQPEETETLMNDFFDRNKTDGQRDYIEGAVRGVMEKADEIDALIEKYAGSVGVDRISSVSLAVLRLGTYEMLYMEDIPAAVSVNEAIGLAKEYDGDEAAPFINGVLGKIKDEIR